MRRRGAAEDREHEARREQATEHAASVAGPRDGRRQLRSRPESAPGGVVASGAPTALKPPSTLSTWPVMARAKSESRKAIAPATGSGSLGVPAERRLLAPAVGELAEAGDAARGDRLQRAGGHEVDADAAAARGRARGSATSPPARPSRRPSSRRPARRRSRRSRGRRSSRRPVHQRRDGAGEVAQRHGGDVERGLRARDRRGQEVAAQRVRGREGDRVQRRRRRRPSARPASSAQRLEVAPGSVTSSSSTSAGCGQLLGRALGQPRRAAERGQDDLGALRAARARRRGRRSSRASARR